MHKHLKLALQMQHLIWVYNREKRSRLSYLFLHMEENRDGKAFFGRPLACSSSGESFTPVGIPRHESWIHAGVERDWLASAAPRGANKPWWRQRAADFPPRETEHHSANNISDLIASSDVDKIITYHVWSNTTYWTRARDTLCYNALTKYCILH